jgi:hypothetical protein
VAVGVRLDDRDDGGVGAHEAAHLGEVVPDGAEINL